MAELLSWHRVGQRVVFKPGGEFFGANASLYRSIGVATPTPDAEYTIREVCTCPSSGGVCFRLREIVNPIFSFSDGTGEPTFCARDFRPLRDTSIDCFRSLLSPTPEDEALFLIELADLVVSDA